MDCRVINKEWARELSDHVPLVAEFSLGDRDRGDLVACCGTSQAKGTMVEKYDWSRLNHLQLGRYAEYFVKMEFTLLGFDVYDAEVDDKGIDFVVRKGEDCYYDVQVKSSRGLNYIFFPKDKFRPRPGLVAAIVLFEKGQVPQLYLIPSTAWQQPNDLLVSHDYEGRESKPEWGVNLSRKNLPLLRQFAFDEAVQRL